MIARTFEIFGRICLFVVGVSMMLAYFTPETHLAVPLLGLMISLFSVLG